MAPIFAAPVAGVGLFAVPWLSDVYGVVAPDGGTGSPQDAPPRHHALTFTPEKQGLRVSGGFDLKIEAPQCR